MGDTPLHATANGSRKGYKSGHRDAALYLIKEAAVDPNTANKAGRLAHELASSAGRPKLATVLQTDLDPLPTRYDAKSLRRGLAIVIANVAYPKFNIKCHVEVRAPGSVGRSDAQCVWFQNARQMVSTLKALEFKIIPKRKALINPTSHDIRAALRKAALTNWNHMDALVVYYCGIAPDTDHITCVSGEVMSLKSLLAEVGWTSVRDCEGFAVNQSLLHRHHVYVQARTMRRKPKLFIMDTCAVAKAPLAIFAGKKEEEPEVRRIQDWNEKKRRYVGEAWATLLASQPIPLCHRYHEADEEKQKYPEQDNLVVWTHAPEHVAQPSHTRRPGEAKMSRFTWHLTRALRRYSRTMDVASAMRRVRRDMSMDSVKETTGSTGQKLSVRSYLGKNGAKKLFLRPVAHEKEGADDEVRDVVHWCSRHARPHVVVVQESDDDAGVLPGRHGMLSVEEQAAVASAMRAEKQRAKLAIGKKQGRFSMLFKRKPKPAAKLALEKKLKSEKAAQQAAQRAASRRAGRKQPLVKRFVTTLLRLRKWRK